MKRVLVIEDEPWMADLYTAFLSSHNWDVSVAKTAEQALELIDSFSPQAVLLDYMLPSYNAPTLLNELQSHEDVAKLPVVLCTSADIAHVDPDSLKAYGVVKVFDKSTANLNHLLTTLEGLV